jgi:DNA modification methylase
MAEKRWEIVAGDCLETLKTLADCSVDSVVTDPPYGLKFMSKAWDCSVPSVDVWRECLRVLKPGGHILAFAGTRTQHRMACAIEDAGFEIRDMIAWVYGCLSDDTEVLTNKGWVPYHKAKQMEILAYDVKKDVYKWEVPTRWHEYSVESDTAYRICGDHTDQVVSRGHRCLVERGGVLAFVPAEELAELEYMPALQDDFLGVPKKYAEILRASMQRLLPGERMGETRAQKPCRVDRSEHCKLPPENERAEQPSMEGWSDLLPQAWELQASKIRPLPSRVYSDGAQGWVCNGAPASCSKSDRQAVDSVGSSTSQKSRPAGQFPFKFGIIRQQSRPQTIRTRTSYQSHMARVERVTYSGVFWCPTVSTGAFVARRNGKVFLTGNSGFPKSLDVSKAIDKAAGAERDVVGVAGKSGSKRSCMAGDFAGGEYMATAPATEAAHQWQGWGTALKPSLEPITVARKPLIGTVADNVMRYGTGALNVDGCRVGDEVRQAAFTSLAPCHGNSLGKPGTAEARRGTQGDPKTYNGRWPANLIHDGSDEVVSLFPVTGPSKAAPRGGTNPNPMDWGNGRTDGDICKGHDDTGGSAARFFYCAKASKRDRDDGCESNNHPTVKPTDLMRYLVRLVTPPGGLVLDPFAGTGSTGRGAILEGFCFLGCEIDASYAEIARLRIEAVTKEMRQPELF